MVPADRPFAHNLASGRTADDPQRPVPPDPSWPEQAERIRARLATTCGHRALRIDHVGSTAVLGLDARDIIDMQITVAGLSDADDLAADLLRAGYPRLDQITADITLDGGNVQWHKRFHGSSDPGRPTRSHQGGRQPQSEIRAALR